jgi:uncharacterized protein YprB with RNaseH-like and TPR domain
VTLLRERLAAIPGARGDGRGRDPLARLRRPHAAFITTEEHLAFDDLGLAVIGRARPDALLLEQLGLRGEAPTEWREILFLDTETSGLAGGAGTYVFLLGTLELADGELIVRQHALFDLAQERAYVEEIAGYLRRFRACASYNGKSFDLPLLKDRVALHFRSTLSLGDDAHLDLVHPARRWWRARTGSARLRDLEDHVLMDPRDDDLPGDEIPRTYFTFLATGDESLLAPITAHNKRDLLALVRLADRMCRVVIAAREGRTPLDAYEAFAMAGVFERHGESRAARECLEAAYHDGDAPLRRRAALPYARALEREGDCDRAIAVVELALALGAEASRSWREQAESRLRRLQRATLRRARSRSAVTRSRRGPLADERI